MLKSVACLYCMILFFFLIEVKFYKGFPGGSVAKNLPANARDTGSVIPDLEEPTCHGAAQSVCHNC